MGESNDGIAGGIFTVTGGTQGVGETVAFALADGGAKGIVICGRNNKNGARVKEALEEKGAAAEFVEADLEIPEDCRKVITACDNAERFLSRWCSCRKRWGRHHSHDQSVAKEV